MMKQLLRWLSILFVGLLGCVHEYDDYVAAFAAVTYQVDGVLSNLPENRTVRLVEARSFGNETGIAPIRQAQVSILVNNGPESVSLTQTVQGYYQLPETYRFQPGSSYLLQVRLPDNTLIRSTPERMPNPVALDTLYAQFSPTEVPRPESSRRYAGHLVYGSFRDPANETNYYHYNWKTWERLTFCAFSAPDVTGLCEGLACSEPCWQQYLGSSTRTFSDALTNGQLVQNTLIAEVPLYETSGFLIESQFESVTKGYYEYLRVLNEQTRQDGVAATPPTLIPSNLSSSESSRKIEGYFTVVAVSPRRLFVDRGKVNFLQYPILGIFGCRNYRQAAPGQARCAASPDGSNGFRTPIRPQGWPN